MAFRFILCAIMCSMAHFSHNSTLKFAFSVLVMLLFAYKVAIILFLSVASSLKKINKNRKSDSKLHFLIRFTACLSK